MVGFNGMYPGGYPAYNNPYANQAYQERMAQLQSSYQQALPQAAPQQPAQAQATINQGLLWVQGEAGAKAYLMAPNTTVLLMDSENERFYIKSTDGAGMPNLRMFSYQEMHTNAPAPVPEQPQIDTSMFVGREEFEGLKQQYFDLIKRLESYEGKEPAQQQAPVRIQNRARKTGGDINE